MVDAPPQCPTGRSGFAVGCLRTTSCRILKRFRVGLVCKNHRLLHHSTLGSRVVKKKKLVGLHGGGWTMASEGGQRRASSAYLYTHTYIHINICIYMYTDIYVFTYIHVYIHMYK